MISFEDRMAERQVAWRRANLASHDWGCAPNISRAELGFGAPRLGLSGSAEPQFGSDAAADVSRGWYSRGYLPHCDHPGLLQVITYRLADSVPAEAVARLDAELQHLPKEKQDVERRNRIDAWMDAGHGACVLTTPDAAACIIDTWRHFAGVRYDLLAWVVMPNHVHVLVRVYEGVALARVVQSWKNYTGRRIGEIVGVPRDGQGLWMRDYWDRYIRDERHLFATIEYIHMNPVKGGLAARPDDWPWSSAREFDMAELGFGAPGSGV